MNESFKDCPGTAVLLWGLRAQADGFTAHSISGLMKPSGQCWTHTRGKRVSRHLCPQKLSPYAGFFMSKHFHLILIKRVI